MKIRAQLNFSTPLYRHMGTHRACSYTQTLVPFTFSLSSRRRWPKLGPVVVFSLIVFSLFSSHSLTPPIAPLIPLSTPPPSGLPQPDPSGLLSRSPLFALSHSICQTPRAHFSPFSYSPFHPRDVIVRANSSPNPISFSGRSCYAFPVVLLLHRLETPHPSCRSIIPYEQPNEHPKPRTSSLSLSLSLALLRSSL